MLIDTGDAGLDDALSRQARKMGVPVDVPDKPALCSFYLGSIVDGLRSFWRSRLVVLPRCLRSDRAAIEDWLPHCYGSLAVYLNRIRHRIRPFQLRRRQRCSSDHRWRGGRRVWTTTRPQAALS